MAVLLLDRTFGQTISVRAEVLAVKQLSRRLQILALHDHLWIMAKRVGVWCSSANEVTGFWL